MGKASRRKKDRRFEREHPKPFRHMDLAAATNECGRGYNRNFVIRTQCKVCEMDVMLHCSNCEIQITGCLCTAVERMSDDDFRTFREEVQKKKAREAGLVLPPSMN